VAGSVVVKLGAAAAEGKEVLVEKVVDGVKKEFEKEEVVVGTPALGLNVLAKRAVEKLVPVAVELAEEVGLPDEAAAPFCWYTLRLLMLQYASLKSDGLLVT